MPMLNVDGNSLYFSVKGKGIPILFIHPPVLTSINFENQIKELSQYFQVITFDIRGHGKSQYSSKPITYPLIVSDIKQLLNHLEVKKAFICGYSAGASIVLEFLLTSKEQALGGIVISGMSEISDCRLMKRISFAIKLAQARAVSVLAWSISWSNSITQKLFIKMFMDSKKGDPRNIVQYYKYCLNYNCTSQLGNINIPVMLIYGKLDKPFYNYARLLHEKLPCNELMFIENADHRIPTKSSNALNEIINQFIKKHTSTEKTEVNLYGR
ncbi:alpha/beta hydrolase [Neobacillus niacini]|uniref:alpha/beta fold hydrolase n=1 Tax=Neobacillus niacini TaxID=86668 RepID=UPI002865653D|nr:alpha/beta hydrolase [Neobacillus niacini]MDR6997814.1 pimeloyl-ACP methyl ester carboxylesterase [Neobacillus niacini]